MKKIDRTFALNAIYKLVEDVTEFVKSNGGIINTQDEEKDAIYSYVFNWDSDEIVECKVLGVKVIKDTLFILPAYDPNYVWGEVDIANVEINEWYVVGSMGDNVLTAQTILSIADSIHQYV